MARAATLGKPKEETYVDYSLIFVVLFLLSFGLRVEFYSKAFRLQLPGERHQSLMLQFHHHATPLQNES